MPDDNWLNDLVTVESERDVMAAVMGSDSESLAESLTGDQLWESIQTCTKLYGSAKRLQSHLKPILGKLLIALMDRPEVYRSKGFETFDDFMTRGAPLLLGLPRSEAYRAKKLASAFPHLTPDEFSAIGEGKLYTLTKITNHEDPNSTEWISTAKSCTHDELRDKIVQAGMAPVEDLIPVQISFSTTLAVKQQWMKLVSDDRVVAIVGTRDYGAILAAVIHEACSTWGI